MRTIGTLSWLERSGGKLAWHQRLTFVAQGVLAQHRDQIDAVVARHPRLQLKRRMVPLLEIETHERPCCRIAFLRRTMGFDRLIAGARMFEE